MRVLLTGGAGFIGSATAHHLLEAGYQVRILDNLSVGTRAAIPAEAEFVQADLSDRLEVRRALEGVEAVLHLAARVSVRSSVDAAFADAHTNVMGTVVLLEESLKAGVRKFVFASSMAVYAEPLGRRKLAETDPTVPLSPYGAGKLAAEQYVRILNERAGASWVVLRLFNVYGAGQAYTPAVGIVKIAVESARNGTELTLFGGGNSWRDFVFVQDVAQAFRLALEFEGNGVFNIGTGKPVLVRDVVERVFELVGAKPKLRFAPFRAEELKCAVADITKAKRVLGFDARTSLEEGLRFTLKAEGLLNR